MVFFSMAVRAVPEPSSAVLWLITGCSYYATTCDVLADVASVLAGKIRQGIPRHFAVLAVDPSGYYLAFAP